VTDPLPDCVCDLTASVHRCTLHPMMHTCTVLLRSGLSSRECNLVTQGGWAGYVAHLAAVHGKKTSPDG
jgi:hypothetical protein